MQTKLSPELIVEVCNASPSMAHAAANLNIHYNTLKRLALLYGCFKPNQGGKNIEKKKDRKFEISLDEIISGLHPQYQTYKLKLRLLESGLIDNICNICGLTDWCNKPLNMELDHIDGNRLNHNLENLRMLCPNCHAQTDTYRSKKRIQISK